MIRGFKKHFIPHPGNDHEPRYLKRKSIVRVTGLLLAVELVFFLLPTLYFPSFVSTLNLSAILPGALSALSNTEREKESVPVLSENALLTRAATLKAQDMAAKGYFAHVSPDGKNPWYWFNLVNYKYSFAGENLAVNFTDSEDVTAAWMRSPTHQANIVNRNYREIGTGMATGTYKGGEAVFVAQLYGTQRSVQQVSAAASVSYLAMLILSPHNTVGIILVALLILTLAVLVMYLTMKPERRRRELVGNGLFLVVFIIGLYIGNASIASRHFESSFVAFDADNQVLEQ